MLSIISSGLSYNVGAAPSGVTATRSSVSMNAAEAAAKAAYLSKLNAPAWGPKGGASAAPAFVSAAAPTGFDAALASAAEAAKSAWLAKQDAPAFKAKAPAMASYSAPVEVAPRVLWW